MTYTSFAYLVFAAVCVGVYYCFPKKLRWCVLLAASAGFYAIVCLKYMAFILITALSTFDGGLILDMYIKKTDKYIKSKKGKWSKEERNAYKAKVTRNKKLMVTAVLVLNFGILAYLKYFNFFVDIINPLINHFGLKMPHLGLFLPLGISFYTFQSMGYIIDIYRGKYEAQTNFAKFALFVSFFPQIVQGPISFYSQLAGQLYEGHDLKFDNIKQGVLLILWGFFKKLVIADKLVTAVTTVPNEYEKHTGMVVLMTALMYAVQLYMDFSGGIDISRGVAQLFGIDMAENFKRPYFSKDISEYWHRWHITLGAWLREYLFYPVAMSKAFQKFAKFLKKHFGMKISKVLPVSIASLITFLVVGIWHGANWKYVAFGLWNGLIIMFSTLFEDGFVSVKKKLHIEKDNKGFIFFQMVRTFFIVLVGYYFDIAPGFKAAIGMMKKSVSNLNIWEVFTSGFYQNLQIGKKDALMAVFATFVVLIVSIIQEKHPEKTLRERICAKGFIWESAAFIVLLFSVLIFGTYGPGTNPADFYYMQF